MTTALTWYLDIADTDWVGPINFAASVNGQVVTDPTGITFAIARRGERPTSMDWAAPAADPAGATAGYGIAIYPVDQGATYGIWAKYEVSGRTIVIGPDQIGWIARTAYGRTGTGANTLPPITEPPAAGITHTVDSDGDFVLTGATDDADGDPILSGTGYSTDSDGNFALTA